jgi:hypothetical protein
MYGAETNDRTKESGEKTGRAIEKKWIPLAKTILNSNREQMVHANNMATTVRWTIGRRIVGNR